MKNKRQAKQSNQAFIVIGLTLILAISLLDGFIFSFINAIQHVISDLTVDIKVHAYIAGLVLLLYGLYRRYTSK